MFRNYIKLGFEIRRSWRDKRTLERHCLQQRNSVYYKKKAGYNYEIQSDQEVNFGYCVTGEGLEIPKVFEICSQRTDKAENEYIVSLNVTNDWGNGFTGEIKIQNLSAEPIPRLLACLILSIYLKLTFRQMSKTFQILIPIQILSRYRLK